MRRSLFWLVGIYLTFLGCQKSDRTISTIPSFAQSYLDSIYFQHILDFDEEDFSIHTNQDVFRLNELLHLRSLATGSKCSRQSIAKSQRLKDRMYFFLDRNNFFESVPVDTLYSLLEQMDRKRLPDYWKAKCHKALADQHYRFRDDIHLAYKHYKKALEIYESLDFICHEQVYLYADLVAQSVVQREYLYGKTCGNQMLNLALNYFTDSKVLLARGYQYLGYSKLLNGESIDQYFQKSFNIISNTIYHKVYQESRLFYTYSKGAQSNISYRTYLDTLVELTKEVGQYVNIDKTIGEFHATTGDLEQSNQHLLAALEYLKERNDFTPGHLLTIYYGLLTNYLKQKDYKNARKYIVANQLRSHDFSSKSPEVYVQEMIDGNHDNIYFSFISFNHLAETFLLENPVDTSSLHKARKLVRKAREALTREQVSVEEQRRIEMLNYSHDIYKTGLHVSFLLNHLTNDKKYLDEFIQLGEVNKSVIFQGDADISIDAFGIPDDIKLKDKLYRERIRYYNKEKLVSDSLSDYLSKVGELNRYYEMHFPNYFNHRILGETTSSILIPDKCIKISFDIVDTILYRTTHEKDTTHIEAIGFQNQLKDSVLVLNRMARDYTSDVNGFVRLSKYVSKILVPLFNRTEVKTIIYSSNSSLINPNLFFDHQSNKYLVDTFHLIKSMGLRFINENISLPTKENQHISVFAFSSSESIQKAKHSIELPGSLLESETMLKKYPGAKIFSGYDATVERFESEYTNPSQSALFLSLHGVSKSNRLDNTYLLFRKNKKILDTLYGYEILPKSSSCENIILSSCFTHEGVEVEGEGQYNISRYFLLNGANRVVSSTWALDDQVTSEFSYLLVKYDGVPQFIRKMKSINSHPYFWGGIVETRN